MAYWNRARQPEWRPRAGGWHSAEPRPPLERGAGFVSLDTGMAFEPGNPSFVGLYVLDNALDYLLALGDGAVERHALALSGEVRQRLAALTLPLMTPEAPERRAGNVCFETPEAPRLREALEAEGVLVSGEDGRVRLSTHLYNDLADVERAVAALERLLGGRAAVT